MVEIRNQSEFVNALIKNNIIDVADLIKKLLNPEDSMESQKKLEELDKLKGWFDSFRPFSPDVVQEMKTIYDVKFTYNSNAIEGNTLTQSETELILEKGITIGGKSLREHLEVIGHKEAIDYIKELAEQGTAVGEREIKDIHNIIMRGIEKEEAGQYRKLDVRAAGTEHVYSPHYRIQELMEDFASWLQSPETNALHPVEQATQAHYKLASIHPFKDGNGRTARLLMNLILHKHGYPIAVISNENRKEYIDSLIHAQESDDDTAPFFEIVIDVVKESLIDYLRIVSTALGNEGKGLPFYQEMQRVIEES